MSVRLDGYEFAIWMMMSVDGRDDRFAFSLPIRYDLSSLAASLLQIYTDADASIIHFLESESD